MTTMLSLYNAFGGGAFNKENCQKTKMRQWKAVNLSAGISKCGYTPIKETCWC
jgi:hypothetical protein